MSSGDDVAGGMFWGAVLGAAITGALAGNCGAYASKQEQCSEHCHGPDFTPKHDGGEMTFDKHGYVCRCANLEPVKP